jgi:ABC-2 type transport system permease protein
MNPILVLMQKELATSLRSRMAVFTLVTLTLVFTLIPLAMIVGSNMLPADSYKRSGLDENMLQTMLAAYPMLQGFPRNQVIQGLMVSSMQPLFLLIPLMIPMTLAVYSIIGEKQTRSLEALLATPISTRDLLLGKCLAAALPGVASAWVSYGIFAVAASVLVPGPIFTNLLMQPAWLLAVVLAMPAAAAFGVLLGLMVSSRASDPQSAQQVAGVIVLPVVALIIDQMTGLVRLSVPITLIAVAILVAIDAALLQAAVRLFGRETILTRWK